MMEFETEETKRGKGTSRKKKEDQMGPIQVFETKTKQRK